MSLAAAAAVVVVTLSSLISGCGIFKGRARERGICREGVDVDVGAKRRNAYAIISQKKDTLHWTLLVR